MPHIQINNQSLYFERSGPSGNRSLILVHGFTCDHSDWKYQVEALRRSFDVIAVDLNCHGQSDANIEHCHIDGFADDIIALSTALNARDPVLIGHSMGCRVTAAAAKSGQFKGLVLVDGSLTATSENFDQLNAEAEEMSKKLDAATALGVFFDHMFFADADPELKSRIVTRAQQMDAETAGLLAARLRKWDAFSSRTALAEIDVPVLAVQSTGTAATGERIPLKPGDTTPWLDLLVEVLPAARIDILQGAGHFSMLEKPDGLNTLIEQFLADLGA